MERTPEIWGFDITSSPSRAKPITWTRLRHEGCRLTLIAHGRLTDFNALDTALAQPGPWIAGFDAPFSFALPFLERIGWPTIWSQLATHLATMDKPAYLAAHTRFRAAQPTGQKHLPRALDRRTGGAPPNNVVNPPVGRMLYELVPRLHRAGLHIPGLHTGDGTRIAVEAYPAIAAKHLIGTTAYKDGPPDDADSRRKLRQDMLRALARPNRFGITVAAPDTLAEDPKGDDIDALLCAVQAAWALAQGFAQTGPDQAHPIEGWIADPAAF